MEYIKLMSILSEINKNKQSIIVYLKNGFVFKSDKNTGVYETTNCLEMDDEYYLEYYACAIEITEILKFPTSNIYNTNEFEIGTLMEFSELNEPERIELSDGQVIWQKGL